MASVRKAVIPAAGLGTRFLPATKASPKEMLTVVDKPAIQYVVEEAVAAGIEDILIITSPSKRAVEDHFDRVVELEVLLAERGKHAELAKVREITALAEFFFTRQGAPLGLGHAVSMAARHLGDVPFAVLLPDDIVEPGGDTLRRLVDAHERSGHSVVALREVPRADVSRYGCPRVADLGDGVLRIDEIVEKPPVETAPSNFAVFGRYVFTPEVFSCLERVEPGVGGEIQLTDAMAELATKGVLAGAVIEDRIFDVGHKLDFLRATVELALDHPGLGTDFRDVLAAIVRERGIGG